ncbi:uncharacterized protein LOC34618513 [Cyclospora cayetanensis]|uniref:Uncharacterized protein LOC34618513 n=1 Tax=Cyclospora cayetanensis TaxID=88456 RepID=A0A6P6RXN2_9EIME|nr:uncharacterized protein LOC34618513 [Cyclospora cayetanensis]
MRAAARHVPVLALLLLLLQLQQLAAEGPYKSEEAYSFIDPQEATFGAPPIDEHTTRDHSLRSLTTRNSQHTHILLQKTQKKGLSAADEEKTTNLLTGGAFHSGSGQPGALKRLANYVRNSSVVDRVLSVVYYFVGSSPGRADQVLLRQSDSVGVGVGLLVHILRMQTPEARKTLSRRLQSAPEVRSYIQRFGELVDPRKSIKESLQQLLWARRRAARLALGAYDTQELAELLNLVRRFKQEYMHLLGFVAVCLDGLPDSLPVLSLFVDRLLIPLQDALRSMSSVSGRFKGFSLALAQQQLLRWVNYLGSLEFTLLQLVPGGSRALTSLRHLNSQDSSLEETDSSYASQEGEEMVEAFDSHL